CASESFSRPVGSLIQSVQYFDEADGINFVNSAGFRIIADGRWVARDGENIANTANGPRAEKRGLQADDVLIACCEMRNGFDASGFERAGDDQGVHADAGHGSTIDVNGIHFFRRHDFIHLLIDAIERKALGRIDFHADDELFFLEFLPEFPLRIALGNWYWF